MLMLLCRPLQFENTNVLHQLRCGGVLEAVRISCAGFPTKTLYEDFVDHFWNLVPELLSNPDLDDKALSKAVLKKANLQGYQCGHTKVSIVLSGKLPQFVSAMQMAKCNAGSEPVDVVCASRTSIRCACCLAMYLIAEVICVAIHCMSNSVNQRQQVSADSFQVR